MALATIVEKKGGWGKREMRPTADESLGRCRMCDARARQLKVGVSLRERGSRIWIWTWAGVFEQEDLEEWHGRR